MIFARETGINVEASQRGRDGGHGVSSVSGTTQVAPDCRQIGVFHWRSRAVDCQLQRLSLVNAAAIE